MKFWNFLERECYFFQICVNAEQCSRDASPFVRHWYSISLSLPAIAHAYEFYHLLTLPRQLLASSLSLYTMHETLHHIETCTCNDVIISKSVLPFATQTKQLRQKKSRGLDKQIPIRHSQTLGRSYPGRVRGRQIPIGRRDARFVH